MLIIGIPVKDDFECFTEMYLSLISSTDCYDKIVVVTPNVEEIKMLVNKDVEVVKEKGNTPLEAYNQLFEIAKEEKADLFVTQTDVTFPKLYKRDWLGIMKEIAERENMGAITSINGGGISGPDYINGMFWLGGWCTYFPYRTIDKVGGYDETFPNGFGVDIDHTYRIIKEGLKIAKLDYWVDHHRMNEREHDKDPDTEQMKQDSSKYFKNKWELE